jgi:DNA-binding CsgD family transcriptional regulator
MNTTLWQRILQRLGLRQATTRRYYALAENLGLTLQGLAEREQRSTDDLAADLLLSALAQRRTAEGAWQAWQRLTPREQEVAALSCLGCTNRQMAARLGISVQTIKTHVRGALYKFDLHSKVELRLALAEWDFSAWQDPQGRGVTHP